MEPDLLDALEQANAQDVSEVLVNPGRRCRKSQELLDRVATRLAHDATAIAERRREHAKHRQEQQEVRWAQIPTAG